MALSYYALILLHAHSFFHRIGQLAPYSFMQFYQILKLTDQTRRQMCQKYLYIVLLIILIIIIMYAIDRDMLSLSNSLSLTKPYIDYAFNAASREC